MPRWEDDVASAVRSAYAERRALPSPAYRRHRNPLARLVYAVWRVWTVVSLWFIIRWLWHVRYVGKVAAVLAGVVWLILALALAAALLPPVPQDSASTIGGSQPFLGSASPGEVRIRNGTAQVGDWRITLTGYEFTNSRLPTRDGGQFQWMIVRWKFHNPSHNAIRASAFDFTATSFGVDKPGMDPSVVGFENSKSLTSDYLIPGQTVSGDLAFQVFRKAKTVKITFDPSEGNPNYVREIWTIRR